jgi:hypothetical protein
MAKVLWKNGVDDKEGVVITKEEGETIFLTKGSFFTYGKRKPCAVRVEEFTQKGDAIGPVGIIYLPWRYETSSWAETAWSLKGNPRHLIAYPVGVCHYGEQIDWETVELSSDPQEIKNE